MGWNTHGGVVGDSSLPKYLHDIALDAITGLELFVKMNMVPITMNIFDEL